MTVKKEIKAEKEMFASAGSVIFSCPQCGKGKIIRSYHERELGTRYTCSECNFSGPN